MKSPILTLLTLVALSHVSLAGFTVPKSVLTMKELSEAKENAVQEEEPLIFVYTDPGTT
ncbi:hypothetical protein [Rubritalea sp.]|uniref:hypothetical protein n=1 Tax=Rubritalea sp. TaxID=2109375 RepID=UPI003EF84542